MQNFIVNISELTMFSFGYIESKGQVINSNLSEEMIRLFTDRTLYISGEQIQLAYLYIFRNFSNESLSVVNLAEQSTKIKKPDYILSNVDYIELITPDVEKIAKGEFLCKKSYSSGFITIPKDVVTGNYYISAYTKFMQNNGLSSYSNTNLKIANPFKSDIQAYNHTNTPLPKYSVKFEDMLSGRDLITVLLNKKEYSTCEHVNNQSDGLDLLTYTIRGLNFTIIPDSSIVEKNNFLHSSVMFSVYNIIGCQNPYSIYFKSENGQIKSNKYSVIGIPFFTFTWLFKLGNYASD